MKTFIFRCLRKSGILKHLNLTSSIRLNKIRFKIPVHGEIGFNNLFLKPDWMADTLSFLFLKTNIKTDRFIDIGANIGQNLLFYKRLDPLGKYTGFEPNPVAANYVKSLIEVNNFQNSEIITAGISSISSVKLLGLPHSDKTDSCAMIMSETKHDHVQQTHPVPLLSETCLSPLLFSPDIIKIDVEGHELEVLTGLYITIKTFRPVIIIEVLPHYMEIADRIRNHTKIESLLIDLGYNIFQINKVNNRLVSFSHRPTLDPCSTTDNCDYLLVPRELEFISHLQNHTHHD